MSEISAGSEPSKSRGRQVSRRPSALLSPDRARPDGAAFHWMKMRSASLLRPGIQSLIADALRGCFDVLLAEAMDRLSRDQEDIAGLFKRLTFANVSMVTQSEGDVTHLHVDLKDTMNALLLKDFAAKTHRG